jgi:hypothetical protein
MNAFISFLLKYGVSGRIVQKALLIPEREALILRSHEAIVTAQDLEQKFRRFGE